MSQETQKHDRERYLKKVVQGLGLTLLGAAAALPVICIYLTQRMLRKDERQIASKRPPAEPKASGSQPIRIPIQIEETQPPQPKETTPTPEDAGAPEAAVQYVASTESDKFHDLQCRWAHQIRQEHRIDLTDREEALARGLVPCGTCRP